MKAETLGTYQEIILKDFILILSLLKRVYCTA